MESCISKFNRIFVHPQFNDRIEAVYSAKTNFDGITPAKYCIGNDEASYFINPKLSSIGQPQALTLDYRNGKKYLETIRCLAYDAAIDKWQALAGSGYATSHALVEVGKDDFYSTNYISFGFYTKSALIQKECPYTRPAEEVNTGMYYYATPLDRAYNVDYFNERYEFITKNCPENSLLLIDGPFMSGLKTSYNIKLNDALLEKNIIPIFIIKNSFSDLIVDTIEELRGQYNSDLHWADSVLKEGQMTNFFKYYDDGNNDRISKIFCYIKPSNSAQPQRIEFHEDTYRRYEAIMPNIMNLIYYFYLDQGPEANVQARPIVIAEKYAEEVKKIFNIRRIMKNANIKDSMKIVQEITQ